MKHKEQTIVGVAIAERDAAIREAVCAQINKAGGIAIVIEAGDGEELLRRLKLKKIALLPHICVIEVAMHGKDGYETLKEIKDTWPNIYVLVFTTIDNEYAAADMMRNGADGYLLKKGHISELITALRTIYDTGHYDSEIATKSLVHAAKNMAIVLRKSKGNEEYFYHSSLKITVIRKS